MPSKAMKVTDRKYGSKGRGAEVIVHNPGAAEVSFKPNDDGLYRVTSPGHPPLLVDAKDRQGLLDAGAKKADSASSAILVMLGVSVTIYTKPNNSWCNAARSHFQRRGAQVTEHDVASNYERKEEAFRLTGKFVTPVIVVRRDGRDAVLSGYDEKNLDEALGISGEGRAAVKGKKR